MSLEIVGASFPKEREVNDMPTMFRGRNVADILKIVADYIGVEVRCTEDIFIASAVALYTRDEATVQRAVEDHRLFQSRGKDVVVDDLPYAVRRLALAILNAQQ